MSKNKTVIAVCIQEPFEDGSTLDLGMIHGDDLKFVHQAFITDTIANAAKVDEVDIRLYHIDDKDRKKLVGIVTEYLTKKLTGKASEKMKKSFSIHELKQDRWGIRVERVFNDCFNAGYKHVIVIGSRTPTVSTSQILTSLKMLQKSDAVFGPTPEGRYYLIGMSGSYQIELSNFDWKSPTIYSEVAQAFTEKGLKWSELEIWYVVECPEDLELLARDINQYRYEGDNETSIETELVLERILSNLEH